MFAFYCRLGLHVGASHRAVIRATRAKLVRRPDDPRYGRTARHDLYRRMIEEHEDARELYRSVMRGA